MNGADFGRCWKLWEQDLAGGSKPLWCVFAGSVLPWPLSVHRELRNFFHCPLLQPCYFYHVPGAKQAETQSSGTVSINPFSLRLLLSDLCSQSRGALMHTTRVQYLMFFKKICLFFKFYVQKCFSCLYLCIKCTCRCQGSRSDIRSPGAGV